MMVVKWRCLKMMLVVSNRRGEPCPRQACGVSKVEDPVKQGLSQALREPRCLRFNRRSLPSRGEVVLIRPLLRELLLALYLQADALSQASHLAGPVDMCHHFCNEVFLMVMAIMI